MAVNESMTASPPMRAIGAEWILRGPGSSMIPRRAASPRTGGTRRAVSASAPAMTMKAGRASGIRPSGHSLRGEQLAIERVHVVHEPRRGVAGEHVKAAGLGEAARRL